MASDEFGASMVYLYDTTIVGSRRPRVQSWRCESMLVNALVCAAVSVADLERADCHGLRGSAYGRCPRRPGRRPSAPGRRTRSECGRSCLGGMDRRARSDLPGPGPAADRHRNRCLDGAPGRPKHRHRRRHARRAGQSVRGEQHDPRARRRVRRRDPRGGFRDCRHYASTVAFVDGFTVAISVCAALALAAAITALVVPGRDRVPATLLMTAGEAQAEG